MGHNQMRNSGFCLLFESEAIYKNYAEYPFQPFTQVWVHLGKHKCHWASGASFEIYMKMRGNKQVGFFAKQFYNFEYKIYVVSEIDI